MSNSEFRPDIERLSRVGIEEAVFCAGKSVAQIEMIVLDANNQSRNMLLTRCSEAQFNGLRAHIRSLIDYDEVSSTGIVGNRTVPVDAPGCAVVTAGTSDLPVAKEAQRTLEYHGVRGVPFYDVGVAGLWRILSVQDELCQFSVVIIVAGMDAALASVVGGLIPAVIIAVPTSIGYGVAQGGRSALESILSSCAPGVTTVNIDNGYGAACAAIRVLNCHRMQTIATATNAQAE